MKKKNIYYLIGIVGVIVGMILSYTFSQDKTELQETLGASKSQAKIIEEFIEGSDISYESIKVSNNSITEGMDENWIAYDLICEDSSTYILIVRKEDNDFTAILDGEGNLVEGIVDNGVLPKYFEEREEVSAEVESEEEYVVTLEKISPVIEDDDYAWIVTSEKGELNNSLIALGLMNRKVDFYDYEDTTIIYSQHDVDIEEICDRYGIQYNESNDIGDITTVIYKESDVERMLN